MLKILKILFFLTLTFFTTQVLSFGKYPACTGDDINKWDQCFGYSVDSTARYFSEWKNGQKNGLGVAILRGEFSGDIFFGNFENNFINGKGIYYFGRNAAGKGDSYVGEFSDGLFSGKGTYSFSRLGKNYGAYFSGMFSNNAANGKGVYGFPEDRYSVGEVKNWKFDGRVADFKKKGSIIEEQIWKNNQLVKSEPLNSKFFKNFCSSVSEISNSTCFGQKKYGDMTYRGDFADGQANGEGIFFSDGYQEYYVGEFKDDSYHGMGILQYLNEDIFLGNFLNGEKNDFGIYVHKNGDRYIGAYVEAKRHGFAILLDGKDQAITYSMWDSGNLVSSEIAENLSSENDEASSAQNAAENISTGTGFFVTKDGFFVTAHHVINGAKTIKVRTIGGKLYDASVVKIDSNNDLAVLKINGKNFLPLPIKSSQKIRRGLNVFAIGFPQVFFQGIEPKVTDGIISSLTGIADDVTTFQISNPIQPGNSGGPLFTLDGNVVGIVNSRLNSSIVFEKTGSLPQNVNYAVKSNYLLEILRGIAGIKLVPINVKRKYKTNEDMISEIEKSVAIVICE
jgi:S1-C subfamily serine protease